MISCAARKRAKASVLQERVTILQTCLLSVLCGYLVLVYFSGLALLIAYSKIVYSSEASF